MPSPRYCDTRTDAASEIVGANGPRTPRQRLLPHWDVKLEKLTINGTERQSADAMFIAIGGVPQTDWAKGFSLRRDQAGYPLTGHDLYEKAPPAEWPLERAPHGLEASVAGVFVAGDVRHGSVKRVAAAVGQGATAVAQVHPHLAKRRRALPSAH